MNRNLDDLPRTNIWRRSLPKAEENGRTESLVGTMPGNEIKRTMNVRLKTQAGSNLECWRAQNCLATKLSKLPRTFFPRHATAYRIVAYKATSLSTRKRTSQLVQFKFSSMAVGGSTLKAARYLLTACKLAKYTSLKWCIKSLVAFPVSRSRESPRSRCEH